MSAALPDVADLLDVSVPPGGMVLAVSDLHLPPQRTTVSGTSCETLANRLNNAASPLTVVLAGDIIELLGFPGSRPNEILEAHDDLCAALKRVTERGGQVVYAIGNHDTDLAWDAKAAEEVVGRTGALLCLNADLIFPDGRKVRVEHGHQLDPHNCFHDQRNPLDTPLGHHIVREVLPKLELLGSGWLDGAHEMADPTDFPAFVGSRLVYRKLVRHLWWLLLLPVLFLFLLRAPALLSFEDRYPDTSLWLHRTEILGYGAVVDLIVIAVLVAVLARRAWASLGALALEERGYEQNQGARRRAADLVADGHAGFLSGHTHHPELRAEANGFYANTGSCTAVVEANNARIGMPPAYLRTQQISWIELTAERVELRYARIVLPGATRLEQFATLGRSPHAQVPEQVACWPGGRDWPKPSQ
jgi:UDP-2,3-diacylglucosamine pyrophosphatase LpxH